MNSNEGFSPSGFCSITNSSDLDISILSVFNETEQQLNTAYENKLTLVRTTEGSPTIEETVSVHLTGNHFLKNEPDNHYQLLFVDPNTLFPLGISFIKNLKNSTYPPVTVTNQEKEPMDQAFCFYKDVASSLHVGFVKALQEVKASNIDPIREFFKSTDLYKKVDFTAMMTVISYVKSYPDIWAEHKEECSYYLYSPNFNKNSSLQAQAPSFMGVLEFKQQDKFETDVIDLAEGYIISYKNVEGKATLMKYSQGVFSSTDESVDIYLRPFFDKKRTYTEETKDTDIIPLLVGKINDVGVMGVTTKQDLQGKAGEPSCWYTFWHSQDFQEMRDLVLNVGGISSVVHFLAIASYDVYQTSLKRVTPSAKSLKTPEELQTEKNTLNKQLQEQQKKLGGKSLPSEDELEASIESARSLLTSHFLTRKVTFQIEKQESLLEELRKILKIKNLGPSLGQALTKLKKRITATKEDLDLFYQAKTSTEKSSAIEKLERSIIENDKVIKATEEYIKKNKRE